MKLSIIICVYNTPTELLSECVESICSSTLDMGSYEILMIDDGSATDYTDLVGKYGIRRIKTENRGIYAARLLGIREARGEYVAYVDSDDTVSFNYHRPMLDCAISGDYDIVYNDWAFRTESTRYYLRRDTTVTTDISAEGEDILARFLSGAGKEHSYSVLWNKLYRRELLCRVGEYLESLTVPEKFNYSEDTLINFYLHKWAKRMTNIHTGYYFYRSHPTQSVAVTSKEKLISHIGNMSFTLCEMKTNVDKREDREKLLSKIDEWSAMMSRTHYSYAATEGYTDLYETIREAYSVDKLSRSTFADGEVYHDTALLGENFAEIDTVLSRIWQTDGETAVAPTRDGYVKRTLDYMIKCGKDIRVEKGGTKIPSPRVSLRSRILHNPCLYKLGMILFPKGSPIRALLKRKL